MNDASENLTPASAPARTVPWTRTFAWLVRRELWEHPAIWIAPVAASGLAVAAHFVSALMTPASERTAGLADPHKAWQYMALYAAASFGILIIGLVVGLLYSLDALQGERRDRSILFWKSLPVSDRLTVLSKAVVPMVLIPAICLVLIVVASLIMLGTQSLVWQLGGWGAPRLWSHLNLPLLWAGMLMGLPFVALWYAPIYAWALLVSAWARRMAILWALAPFLGFLLVEHLLLHKTPVHWVLERWFADGIREPFLRDSTGNAWIRGAHDLDPWRIYTEPKLWIGVVIAALLLALTVRLRRSRAPI